MMNEAATAEVAEPAGVEETTSNEVSAPNIRPVDDWRDSLPSDIRNGLGDVGTVEDLAKGYVNAQSMIGNSIRIPGKEAGKEDWDKFYGKFSDVPGLAKYDPEDLSTLYDAAGRPSDANGYQIEGAPEEFLKVAHEAGLNRNQVESLLEYEKNLDSQSDSMEQDSINSGINNLRQEWGLAFDRKVEEGQRAVAFLEQTSPGLAEALDATGAGNNPAVIKLFQALGANLKEGEGFSGTHSSNSGMTPSEARAQISEIQNNLEHPYHKGDETALEKYLELHRFANPE